MKSKPDADRAVRALIQRQRDLAHSTRSHTRLRILWVAALLDKHLKQCTDHEVGELMVTVQGRFGLFEPEFAICHHARHRLMLRNAKEQLTK